MKRSMPLCFLVCVLALAGAGCTTAKTHQQQPRDAAVSDAALRDAGGHPPPTDAGHHDAADTGSLAAICVDTRSKWSALVDAHNQCDSAGDCDQVDDWSVNHCACIAGIQATFRRDARAILDDFRAQVSAQCRPGIPRLAWPGEACDVAPMRNLRCENHVCTADGDSCGRFNGDSGMRSGDGG